MDISTILIRILIICILLTRGSQAMYKQDGSELVDQNDVDTVIISLTKLDIHYQVHDSNDQIPDVNDKFVELQYRIMNRSDNDIWILKSIDFLESGFEAYITEDNKTLLIRRRLNIPTYIVWMGPPNGWYVRLRSGEDWTETLSLPLPVRPSWLFSPPISTAEYARRLVLEIGYHTKDLPRTVSSSEEQYPNPDMVELVGLWYYEQANEDEQFLSITIDGVYIPYGTQTSDQQSQQIKNSAAKKTDGEKLSDQNSTNKS